jgi:hypothetical protein
MNFSQFQRGKNKNESQRLWRRKRRRTASDGSGGRMSSPVNNDDFLMNDGQATSQEATNCLPNDSTDCTDLFIDEESTSGAADNEEHASFSSIDAFESSTFNDSSSDSSDNSDYDNIAADSDDETQLYRHSAVSVHQSALILVRFCRKVNLNKRGVKNLLNTLHDLLPIPNKLPRTHSGLIRQVRLAPSKRVSYHCCQCMTRLSSANDSHCSPQCSLDKRPRLPVHVGELYTADVEKQVKIVAENHLSLIANYTQNFHLIPCDIPNSRIFRRLPHTSNEKHLTLLLQTDGAPLIKLGTKSLWPIQASIVEIPPPVRDYESAVMVLGAWLGSVHPDRELLWRKVIDQIKVSAPSLWLFIDVEQNTHVNVFYAWLKYENS